MSNDLLGLFFKKFGVEFDLGLTVNRQLIACYCKGGLFAGKVKNGAGRKLHLLGEGSRIKNW